MRDRTMNQKDQKEYSQKRHDKVRKQYQADVEQFERVENEAKAKVVDLYDMEADYVPEEGRKGKWIARQFVDFLEETF